MASYEPRITKYRGIVAEKLHELIPELRDVSPHAGAFSKEAVKRFSTITPSARVIFLHMRAMKRNNIGHLIGPALMGVYLITKDPRINQGFAPALDLAERVADAIELNNWGLPWAAAARVREIEPFYSDDLDKMGVAVAGVTFLQEIQIGRDRHQEDQEQEYFYGFGENPNSVSAKYNDGDYDDIVDLGL